MLLASCRERFAPEARVSGSVHNFGEEASPARRANVYGANSAVQNADAMVLNLPFAGITLPPRIRCGSPVDADKTVAAVAVDVERHVPVKFNLSFTTMHKNSKMPRRAAHV